MNERNISISSFSTHTIWEIPSEKNVKWRGVMDYDPRDGVKLSLHGEDGFGLPGHRDRGYDVLLGRGSDSKLYTLVQSFPRSGKSNFGGGREIVIYGNYLVSGFHIKKRNDRVFKSISFKSSSFLKWTNPNNIDVDFLSPSEIKVHYQRPESIRFSIDSVGDAEIWWGPRARMAPGPDAEYLIEEDGGIIITFLEAQSIDYVIDIVRKIDSMTSFAVNEFSGPPICHAQIEGGSTDVQIYIHKKWPENVSKDNEKRTYFLMGDVDNLSNTFSSWFQAADQHKEALAAYFTERVNIRNIVLNFLGLVQAVEGLARWCVKVDEPSLDERKNLEKILRKSIKSDFPNDFRKRFGRRIYGRLKGLADAPLEDRLLALCECYEGAIFQICPEFKSIIPSIVSWRNNITHRNPMEDFNQRSVDSINMAKDALFMLSELMILDLMKIPESVHSNVVCNSYSTCFRDILKT